MKKLSLILSFDYELPLGGCASYDRALFGPSRELLALSDRLQVPVVLFADVCSAMRFEAWDRDGYYRPFIEQIQTFVDHGHDVQLHIHAHWLTSEYRDGRITPSRHFGLGEFDDSRLPYSVPEIVDMTSGFLVNACREVDSGYSCIAYRAGGYNFHPNAASILRNLYRVGIRLESSVTKGFFLKATSNYVDQTECPSAPNWFIDLASDPTTPGDSRMMEVPIAAMAPGPLSQIRMRIDLRRRSREIAARQYDHSGYSFPNPGAQRTLLDRWKMLMNPVRLSFDQGHYDLERLLAILRDSLRRYEEYDEAVLSVISHPKSMGAYQLKLMEAFVEAVRTEFGSLVDLCTYRDVYDDRNLGA